MTRIPIHPGLDYHKSVAQVCVMVSAGRIPADRDCPDHWEAIARPAVSGRQAFREDHGPGLPPDQPPAGDRGSSHLRKNHGFHPLAEGPDLVADAPPDSFQRVRLYKRGGLIRLSVDGRTALPHLDDGSVGGPPHTHPGWIGLRQMAHTHRCEYDDLAVYPLCAR